MLRVVLIALFAGFVGAGLQMLVSGYFGVSGSSGSSGSSGYAGSVEPVQDTNTHADADGGPPSTTSTEIALSQDQNEDLTGQLRQQQIAQLELQREMDEVATTVAVLQRKLEALEDSSDTAQSEDLSGLNDSAVLSENLSQEVSSASAGDAPPRQRRLRQFEAAGVDAGTAEQLLTRLDQQQLAELELRDEAARGGWLESDEYEERQQELETSAPDLQRELGDDGYDRYLFATGRANRVRVDSVINGSAAQQADVRQGDLIINYAGEQIYRINDLQAATRDGVRGEFVGLILQRGQETITQSVERET